MSDTNACFIQFNFHSKSPKKSPLNRSLIRFTVSYNMASLPQASPWFPFFIYHPHSNLALFHVTHFPNAHKQFHRMEYNADLPVCLQHIYIVFPFPAVYVDMQTDSYEYIYYACLFVISLRSIVMSP